MGIRHVYVNVGRERCWALSAKIIEFHPAIPPRRRRMYMHVCVKRSPVFQRTKPVIAHLEKREKKKTLRPSKSTFSCRAAPRGVATHKGKRCRLSARFHANLACTWKKKRHIQGIEENLLVTCIVGQANKSQIFTQHRECTAPKRKPSGQRKHNYAPFLQLHGIRIVLRVHSSDVVSNCCVQDPQIAHVNCNSPAIHRDCTHTHKKGLCKDDTFIGQLTPRTGMAYPIINQYVVDWHICANRYWPLRGYAVVECIWSMLGANETIIFLLQKTTTNQYKHF